MPIGNFFPLANFSHNFKRILHKLAQITLYTWYLYVKNRKVNVKE